MEKVYIRQLRDKAKDQVVELVRTDDIGPINRFRQPPFEAVASSEDEFKKKLPLSNRIYRFYIHQFTRLFGMEPGQVKTEEKRMADRKKILERAKDVLRDLKEQEREAEAYQEFLKADKGIFDGFDFADAFHKNIHKEEALLHLHSNIDGFCRGIDVGNEYVDVYFFCEPSKARKQVRFHRSVYVF